MSFTVAELADDQRVYSTVNDAFVKSERRPEFSLLTFTRSLVR